CKPVSVPMLTLCIAESGNNGHVSIRTGPQSKGRRWPGLINHVFFYITWMAGCQDNAPCHKAKMVQEWFDEHNNEFEVLTWPPNSPDLNPIEHLWDVLDKQV
ncbi:hypothetical protein QTP70_026124, partial [Hemibagrus guttatus]